jgi:hypothetical protein
MTPPNLRHDLEAGNAPVNVHQHLHAAPPLVVTEKSAEAAGLTAKALRKLCRQGLAHTRTLDGVTVLRVDLEAWFRASFDAPHPGAHRDPEAAALERAGLRLVDAPRAAGGRR